MNKNDFKRPKILTSLTKRDEKTNFNREEDTRKRKFKR